MIADEPSFEKSFNISGGDFVNAGEVASKVKKILQGLGISNKVIRRATIATYEAEMNVVWYARQGTLTLSVTPELLHIKVTDEGNGIENIELAMQEGYSTASEEIREMGFGAGMGLPNIKKNSDSLKIDSEKGKGALLAIFFDLKAGG